MENNTWMEGEGGGVVLADLGRMSLLKRSNRPRVTWNKRFPLSNTSTDPFPCIPRWLQPHRWLSSGLHASLTTFGAGDRQGKAQWMRMPGTWKFCESYLPYLLGYVWGSWFQKQDDYVKCLLLEVRKSSPCKKTWKVLRHLTVIMWPWKSRRCIMVHISITS